MIVGGWAPGGALDPEGPNAERADDLWQLMLYLSIPVFLLFLGLLLLGLRRRNDDGHDDESVGEAASARPWLVGGGVILPAVVVVVVLVATVVVMAAADDDLEQEEAVVVDVIGHQWWWEFRYPDLDVVTASEIHLPADQPVLLRITSSDVIHSFWVPALAGKMDALPDDVNQLVVQADEPGRYPGRCAEFCGLQHANMELSLVAHDAADFDRWVREHQQPAAPPDGAVEAEGAALFTTAGCGDCHRIEGTDASGREGPDLTHLASRRTLASSTVRLTAENLRRFLRAPHEVKTGIEMPPADVSDDELDALVTYLLSLE